MKKRRWFADGRVVIPSNPTPPPGPPYQSGNQVERALTEELKQFVELCETAIVMRDPETGEKKTLQLTAQQKELARLMLANPGKCYWQLPR